MNGSNLSLPAPIHVQAEPEVVRELTPQTPSTVNTFTHTLGAVPSHVSVRYRSKTYTSNGVSAGMELDATAHNTESGYSGHSWQGLWVSSTQVKLCVDSTTRNFIMPNGSPVAVDFGSGQWELVVRVLE